MLKKIKSQLKKVIGRGWATPTDIPLIRLLDILEDFISDVLEYREEHTRTHTSQDRRLDSLEKEAKKLQIRVKNLELKK